MAMNPNVGAANMNPMGGPVPGAPMPMMNNVAAPQATAAAAARQQPNDSQRGILNTYIYEYFIRFGMYECARSLLSSEQQVNVLKDGANRRRDEAGNSVNGADDPMDTDSKSDFDSKLPDDLPIPRLPMPNANTSFLYEWFCLFWDVYNSSRGKSVNGIVHQYVAHTQEQQSRFKQNQQHELLRQMRPDMAQQQYHIMRNMQGGNVNMGMKQGNLARAAMANNQHPQMMLQQAKHSQMQRDPSSLDANRDRPASPASGENAPSPSKRQRIDGAGFNANQPGAMMANGRPEQGIPGQQMGTTATTAAAQHMLSASGINPGSLGPQQFQQFVNTPGAQQKSIASYSHNLQQHHGTQMGTKQMPNAGGPQNQGSPMMPPGSDGSALGAFYNSADITGPPGIRPGPPGSQTGGSNHALQDYQMQLMLLEQQNKKRLMMARQEQDNMPMPRDPNGPGGPGGPGAPQGPNGQPFPEASPQTMRSGASPNPAEQMKRTPQMINSSIPSPVPEGGQSRGSPNPAINFIGNHVDPNMAPHFFKGMEGNMAVAQAQMNGGMRPPSSHPGQPFNGQMTPQHMMAARQQQQQQQQQQGQQPQPGQQPGGQSTPQQWQQGPNGQMVSQGIQPQNQQVQGTPQQRSMPPPSAPAAAATAASNRTTASPQQATAAPPTPNQSNKSAPKKKETKAAKDKRAAAQKKATHNAGATPAAEASGEPDAPAPVTPITPVNPGFNKNGQNGSTANPQTTTAGPAPAAPATAAAPQVANAATMAAQGGQGEANPNGPMNIDNFNTMVDFGGMELANPLQSGDVLNDFDFDSFLHEDNNEPFDFNGTFPGMDGGEIGAD